MTENKNPSQDLLQTSLYSWHKHNKAKLIDFGGWEMPLQYEKGILNEHLAVCLLVKSITLSNS